MPQAVQIVGFIASCLTVMGVLYLIIKTWNTFENKTTQHDRELAEIRKWILEHVACEKRYEDNMQRILSELRDGLSYLRGKAEERRFHNGMIRDIPRERRDNDD